MNYSLNYSYKKVPTLWRFAQDNSTVRGIMGAFGCLPEYTEVLTSAGWVKYPELTKENKVAQWHPDTNEIDFTYPLEIYKYPADYWIKFSNGMKVSPEHRVPYYDEGGVFNVDTAESLLKKKIKIRIPIYNVSTKSQPILAEVREKAKGFKYSIKIPTSFYVVRQNGRIFITGNSGKSSACTIELIRRGLGQKILKDGKRRTRFAVIRQTFRQLEDTTKKTIFDWLPPRIFGDYQISKNIYTIKSLPDTEIEILFRALDKPEDVENLMSLELTGAWVNEAREISLEIVNALTGRIGRYPSVKDGGCTWSGIWMDTNPPDDESWWFKKFEIEKPKGWKLFKQPSGLSDEAENILTEEEWKELQENPDADIVPALPPDYYTKMMEGKSKDWIKVYIEGKYAILKQGKPVYEQSYNDEIHYAKEELHPVYGMPIVAGFDFGLNPSAVLGQLTPSGRLIILDELTSDGVGLDQFLKFYFTPFFKQKYADYELFIVGDPAGTAKGQTDEVSCYHILNKNGYKAIPARTNVLSERLGAVEFFLNALVQGKPRFQLSNTCPILRKGFMSGYHYRKLKVSDERYTDTPDKNSYSHCFVAGTKVNTDKGLKNIEDITIEDKVLTLNGYKSVLNTYNRETNDIYELKTSDNKTIIATGDHRFFTKKGWATLDTLQYLDILYSISENKEGSQCENILNMMGLSFTKEMMDIISVTGELQRKLVKNDTCTEECIRTILEIYLKDMLFITKTTIKKTTHQTIYNSLLYLNIQELTMKRIKKIGQAKLKELLRLQELQQQNGIKTQEIIKQFQNLLNWVGNEERKIKNLLDLLANTVEKNLHHGSPTQSFVVQLVFQQIEELQEKIMLLDTALSVESPLLQTNTQRQKLVEVKVVSVKLLGEARKVYDIEVEDNHHFFANNILVHNCHDALQYLCLHFINKSKPVKIPKQEFQPAISYAGY